MSTKSRRKAKITSQIPRGTAHDCSKRPPEKPKKPRKKKCQRCLKYFAPDQPAGHYMVCRYKYCRPCNKAIPPHTTHDCPNKPPPKPKKKCNHCCKYFLAEKIEEHSKECKFTKCPTCNQGIPPDTIHACPRNNQLPKKQCKHCRRLFPAEQIEDHSKNCKIRRCSICYRLMHPDTTHDCLKMHLPKKERRLRKRPRSKLPKKRCSRCLQFFPEGELKSHFEQCRFRTCCGCSMAIIPDTIHDCPKRKCSRCRKSGIPKEDFQQHLLECNFKYYQACHKQFPPDTLHICKLLRCSGCNRSILKMDYPYHRPACFSLLYEKRLALRNTGYCGWLPNVASKPCHNTQADGLFLCEEHAEKHDVQYRKYNTAAEKQKFRSILLHYDRRILFWRDSFISVIAQKWRENAKTVIICDIEACNLSYSMSHLNVFEIAIATAEGQWIVPPTTHYEMTKKELFKVNATKFINGFGFCKFYGDIDETEAKGIGERTATWKAVGEELEAYTKQHGAIDVWLDWSLQSIDWHGVYAGLASVGFEYLLPSAPLLQARGARRENQKNNLYSQGQKGSQRHMLVHSKGATSKYSIPQMPLLQARA